MRKRWPSVPVRHVLCCSISPSLVAKSVATVPGRFPADRRPLWVILGLGAYRNSGQQTTPTAKIIPKVQKSLFFIVDHSQKGPSGAGGRFHPAHITRLCRR